jgi:M6 family metalloprotease-like protein
VITIPMRIVKALLCLMALAAAGTAAAINASPLPFKETQPDGTVITLRIQGSEHFHWLEDMAGYTVVQTKAGYFYATLEKSGGLAAGPLMVGRDDPAAAGLEKRLLPPEEVIARKELARERQTAEAIEKMGMPEKVQSTGTLKNLVIPIRFSNHAGRTLPSRDDMDVLFNAVGGDPTRCPTGSVRDVYTENSYGQLTLESTVLDWVNVPNTEMYYANGDSGDDTLWQALKSALNTIDATVNFRDFDTDNDNWIDAIAFLHSGYAAEFGGTDAAGVGHLDRIWSHRWTMNPVWTSAEGVRVGAYHISPALWGTSGSAIGRVGVICHETGHFLGLPDLYDTSKPGSGLGSWCLMANSWGFDNSQLHPPALSAWCKIQLGWTVPTVLTTPGNYALAQWALNNQVYRINHGFPSGEYLLIENRQPVGMETAMPQGGLAIYHIDDASPYDVQGYPGQEGWPENGKHYRVALLQADGQYHLERETNRGDAGDLYRASGVSAITPDTVPSTDSYRLGTIVDTGITISGISAPGATMGFRYTYGDDLDVTPTSNLSMAGPFGGPFTPTSKTYTVYNSHPSDSHGWSVSITGGSPWLSVNTPGGTLAPGASAGVDVTLVEAVAETLSPGHYTDEVVFTNLESGWSFPISVSLTVSIHWFSLDSDPGWSVEGQWSFGQPAGQGGGFGSPDPTSGHTGLNVYGYNLMGNYADDLTPQYLTTPAFNFYPYQNLQVQYWRWLGVESSSYDHATFEASNDGENWTVIWENTDAVTDDGWIQITHDISSVADGQQTVYLRWGMGATDSIVNYCGWNIDDIAIVGDMLSVDCDEPPVLTLVGDNPAYVDCNQPYVDAGATALDSCDGPATSAIVVDNPVDASVPGEYIVTYSVSDSGGHASTAARTVIVADATAPEIVLAGEASVTLECGSAWSDPGATALDLCDGDLTASIQVSGSVDTAQPGLVEIAYSVVDTAGLSAMRTRTVTVVDTQAPVITIGVDETATFACGAAAPEATPQSIDACDGDVSGGITVEGSIDPTTPGIYKVVYGSADSTGNYAEVTRTVIIEDSIAPEITMLGDNPVVVECRDFYLDPGYTAVDGCDGHVTQLVQIASNLPLVLTPGDYTVTYSVQDSEGNMASVDRAVQVVDSEIPHVTLIGAASISIACKGSFVDPGAYAADSCDGILDSFVTVEGEVDVNTPGAYTLTYSVTDLFGNISEPVTRTLHVQDDCPQEEGEAAADGEAESFEAEDEPLEGEGVSQDGEATDEGEAEASDGEGEEGAVEAEPAEGEGVTEAEANDEGEGEGDEEEEGEAAPRHSADPNGDNAIDLTELLRVVQLFNAVLFGCQQDTEDGYAPYAEDTTCAPHAADYSPQDWMLSLSELLRLVQLYNTGGYHTCGEAEDGFCPGRP